MYTYYIHVYMYSCIQLYTCTAVYNCIPAQLYSWSDLMEAAPISGGSSIITVYGLRFCSISKRFGSASTPYHQPRWLE